MSESAPRTPPSRLAAMLLVSGAVFAAFALVALRLHFQPPTVPPYALTGESLGAGTLRVTPGQHFALELRPSGPVEGAVAARAFLVRGREVRAWDPPFTVDRSGAVRISGMVDQLFAGVPSGPWEIAIAVGRPELLPTAPNDVLRGRSSARSAPDGGGVPSGWYLVLEPIFREA